MATLLELVQGFCVATGLDKPNAVVSNQDDQISQIVGILNEGTKELGEKYQWSFLQFLATFNSTGVESQGTMDSIAPGYRKMLDDTLWSNSNRLPGRGGITPADSQALRIWGRPNALVNFRQMGGELHFLPPGTAGLQYSFEYQSRFCVWDNDDKKPKEAFTKDTDTTILPAHLYRLDLRWRWKMEKGLAYSEHMRTFESACKQAYADSTGKMQLSMGTQRHGSMPGIIVPLGNWQQP
jgi:hypothetical protein